MIKRYLGILILTLIMNGCVLLPTTLSSTSNITSSMTDTTISISTTTTTVFYSTPEEVRIVEKYLIWNDVEGATGYEITINQTIFISELALLALAELPYGWLDISIIATGPNAEDSLPATVSLEFVPDMAAPTGIRILEGVLYWDVTPEATYYIVVIDDNNIPILGEGVNPPVDLSYSLSSLSVNQYHSIYVLAGLDLWVSESSTTIVYDGSFEYTGSYTLDYSLESTEDLTLEFGTETTNLYSIEGEGYFEGGMLRISYIDGILRFHREYLEELSYGEFVFMLTTSDGIFEIQLLIYDTRKPYMISSSQIYVSFGVDVVLDFMLFDGEFMSLSGNDITEEDFLVEGSRLTISGDYIQFIFTRDPERTVLILGYTLAANEHITIGYLFIRIQTE